MRRELIQSCNALFGRKQISFLVQFCGSFLVLIQESIHLQIFKPLVADEFEAVASGVVLQISIGRVNKAIGQIALFLEEIVCQSCIIGVLCNIFDGLAAQNCIQISASRFQRSADIIDHRLSIFHILEHSAEFTDIASHVVRSTYQRVELVGTGLHHHVCCHDIVSIILIVHQKLLHIAVTVTGGLAGEAGRLGYITASIVIINRPVDNP